MAIRDRKYLLAFVVAGAIIQLCFNDPLLATTKYLTAFTCPVCSSRFEGYRISSTNTFGGVDRDFLKRAFGDQPVLLVPKTCPKCFYSGYGSDFDPKAEITDAVKEQILSKKTLKPIVPIAEGAKSYEIPAEVQYDLIAQTYQLRGKTEEDIAHQYHRASWAVRLESYVPKTILGEELARKVGDWQTSHWNGKGAVERGNPVLYAIQKGREYAEVAKSSEGEVRMIAAIAAIGTLRSYGENPEAQKTLPVLKTVMPGELYSQYEQCLNDSIAREQGFQSKAVLLFEKAIPTKEDSTQKAALTYLCGELHRRLGNWDKAKSYYEQCVAIEGHPKWLDEWVEEQKDLLPQ